MRKFVDKARSLRARVSTTVAGAVASLAAVPAFAAAPDTTSITTTFDEYKVAVIALVIAFAVVLWAIKGAGLLKPRG